MEENVLTVLFDVESEGYQAFAEIKNQLAADQYTVLQGALVKKTGNMVSTIDMLTSGVDSMDDTLKGGLIGGLVGILGGLLGVLLGGMAGHLIGGAKDVSDIEHNDTMLETVGAKLIDGEVAMLLLVQEEDETELDDRFRKFKTTILRRDAAVVQDEVEEAEKLEKEMADEAHRKLHEERSAERKQKIESNRAKMKANFAGFKEKFKKS